MKITILQQERDPDISKYSLGLISELWREQGHEIVALRGLARPVEGDIVFLHVDLTVVPAEYVRAVAGHPCVVNGGILDISKTRISRNRVRSPEDWDGPVIVKTVLNHGGYPERRARRHTVIGRLRNGVEKLISRNLGWATYRYTRTYPVFESARQVPRRVWFNRHLMVERFLPERVSDGYGLRYYGCLGEAERNEIIVYSTPVGTAGCRVRVDPVPIPEELRAIRRELGLDFGAIDYTMHDGHPVVFDVTKTPGAFARNAGDLEHAGQLAPGLDSVREWASRR